MMRTILAVAAMPLLALAACNGGTAGSNAADAPAANASAAPAANDAKPAEAAPGNHAAADPGRAGEIAECVADVQTEVPPGTDLNAFCGCAVDKMQMGLGERDAMEQCAAQMGIQPRGR
jgi:hypothetical protein